MTAFDLPQYPRHEIRTTWGLALIMAMLVAGPFFPGPDPLPRWIAYLGGGMASYIFLEVWFRRPLRYHVDPRRGLGVERRLRTMWFAPKDIKEAQMVRRDDLGKCLKIAGMDFLGSWGLFWSERLGFFHPYVRTLKAEEFVLVRTKSRIVLLLPQKPREMIDYLRQTLALAPD